MRAPVQKFPAISVLPVLTHQPTMVEDLRAEVFHKAVECSGRGPRRLDRRECGGIDRNFDNGHECVVNTSEESEHG